MVFTYIALHGICISYVNNRIGGVIVSALASSSVDQAPIGTSQRLYNLYWCVGLVQSGSHHHLIEN
jgi:hypothetical protein